MSFNKITIIGNLGRDPELRYTPQGKPVCDFSVATSERWKDPQSGENKEETTWFRITFWGRQAEVASQYLKKGRPVYVEGRLKMREWTDRDGRPRTSLEVMGSDLQLIGTKMDGEPAATAMAASASTPTPTDAITEDDIPF
jgi:single-strand DNA-binding protein